MAIRPPKYNSQGFTLIELLVSVLVIGIIAGMASPSLLSLNKPLRDGSLQFQAHLSLIRSKAISTNRAYRLRPKYLTTAEYRGQNYQQTPHNFIVEYARNCQESRYGYGLSNVNPSTDSKRPYNSTYPDGAPDGWQVASELDLDLPETIGVSATPAPKINGVDIPSTSTLFTIRPANRSASISLTAEPYLNWSICYDNRGVASQAVSLTLKDSQGNNKAKFALIDVTGVGSVDIRT
ncbi:prepilin-type N-terminal cleavage/methylation domain-containing protein, partial [Chamaesiphon sp. VAR_69_metabat_338]|uniref:pilus assembly FimT family protein n=1 Tax=Chamaesiphon sp. VAR_69_metabat_338 TaxID=2964704 RepID=UPI00286DEF1A